VADDLRDRVLIEICAPCGFGKSILLRHIATKVRAWLGVPVVYLQMSGDDVDDLLQRLVRELYEFSEPTKLPPDECAALLRHTRAIFVLDDVAFGADQVAYLLEALSGCGLLVGCTRSIMGRHGMSLTLGGLPDDAAADLVQRSLGRPLAGFERPALSRLIRAVEGQPLRLRQAAALVRVGEHNVTELAGVAERDPAELDRLSVGILTQPERRLLAALTLTAGAMLPRELLESIADVGRMDYALVQLCGRGLADESADRFGLPVCRADSYRKLLYKYFDLAGAARSIVDSLVTRDPTSEQSLSVLNAALSLINHAADEREWTTMTRLVRVVEPVLALVGRWRKAHQVLELGLRAAKVVGDRSAEAFFAHEQGTLALCQDDWTVASDQLTRSLELRRELDDTYAADITLQNLALISPVPMPPRSESPRQRRSWRDPRRLVTIATLVVASLAAGSGAATLVLPDSEQPEDQGKGGPPSPGRPSPARSQPPSGGAPQPQPRPPELGPGGDYGYVNISPGRPLGPIQVQEFTVTNPNDDSLRLTTLTVSGDPAFKLDRGSCGSEVPAGGACLITVTFQPARLGSHTGILTATDEGGLKADRPLTGIGYVELTVGVQGDEGSGVVHVGDGLADCPPDCSVWVSQPRIGLLAEPNAGFEFDVWEGEGSCQDDVSPSCELEPTKDTNVSAVFHAEFVVE
jgi:hypothetical protein